MYKSLIARFFSPTEWMVHQFYLVHLRTVTHSRPETPRSDIVNSLAHLRQEWQETVDGENLIDVQASVGLLLGDVVMMLGLSSDEQVAVLGEELRREFIQVVRYRNGGNV